MTNLEVLTLLYAATSEADWAARCESVRVANGGLYPANWYQLVIQSGLAVRVFASFGA